MELDRQPLLSLAQRQHQRVEAGRPCSSTFMNAPTMIASALAGELFWPGWSPTSTCR